MAFCAISSLETLFADTEQNQQEVSEFSSRTLPGFSLNVSGIGTVKMILNRTGYRPDLSIEAQAYYCLHSHLKKLKNYEGFTITLFEIEPIP